ncbi:general secretion pathway protein GspB [Marinobacter sp. M3C]|uniref:general secretion pathway protein GspB n=1 Tax=Marinobacter sp. M3C TaxID=2917715 RepID=UPI00200FF897|nr:general secretion pathway protein GspB [Marinobacter sp. M3C]UQG60461.1 general secretion pathway protein GspB [Marinobacter sp. M3C]
MSYILDALRKSESERHQGKVPDLGRQLQLIHRPPKRHWPIQVLLAAGLLLNAGVLAYVFWPDQDDPMANLMSAPEEAPTAASVNPVPATAAQNSAAMGAIPAPQPSDVQSAFPSEFQSPTVIVPSGYGNSGAFDRNGNRNNPIGSLVSSGAGVSASSADGVRVPHLVELPLSFQRSVPDLTVNSHIFASVPQARRVMINNQNLRPGDSFQGLRVEEITEDGVVLSRQGQQFRLGIVRDWMSPR